MNKMNSLVPLFQSSKDNVDKQLSKFESMSLKDNALPVDLAQLFKTAWNRILSYWTFLKFRTPDSGIMVQTSNMHF